MKRYVHLADSIKEARDVIYSYDQDTIDYINEFREAAANLKSYSFVGDDLVEVDNASDIDKLKHSYVYPALHEGVIKDEYEFNEIVNALNILYPLK